MKKEILMGAVLFLPLVAGAADIKPLALKPGLWEMTTTRKVQLPEELLSKMPPDRRAQMETPSVVKTCLTPELLSRALNLGANERQTCQRKLVSSSASKQEVDVECTTQNGKVAGRMVFEALSPESGKGKMQMTREGGMGLMKINVSVSAKYLGKDCGDVKPR